MCDNFINVGILVEKFEKLYLLLDFPILSYLNLRIILHKGIDQVIDHEAAPT